MVMIPIPTVLVKSERVEYTKNHKRTILKMRHGINKSFSNYGIHMSEKLFKMSVSNYAGSCSFMFITVFTIAMKSQWPGYPSSNRYIMQRWYISMGNIILKSRKIHCFFDKD